MKACTFHWHGTAKNVAKVEEIAMPDKSSMKPGEIIVRVRAASINPMDNRTAKGEHNKYAHFAWPRCYGFDFAGTVDYVHGGGEGGVGGGASGGRRKSVVPASPGVAPKPGQEGRHKMVEQDVNVDSSEDTMSGLDIDSSGTMSEHERQIILEGFETAANCEEFVSELNEGNNSPAVMMLEGKHNANEKPRASVAFLTSGGSRSSLSVGGSGRKDRFEVGDRVFGVIKGLPQYQRGGLAEYVIVEADACARIPASVSFTDAASVSLVGLTALKMFRAAGLKEALIPPIPVGNFSSGKKDQDGSVDDSDKSSKTDSCESEDGKGAQKAPKANCKADRGNKLNNLDSESDRERADSDHDSTRSYSDDSRGKKENDGEYSDSSDRGNDDDHSERSRDDRRGRSNFRDDRSERSKDSDYYSRGRSDRSGSDRSRSDRGRRGGSDRSDDENSERSSRGSRDDHHTAANNRTIVPKNINKDDDDALFDDYMKIHRRQSEVERDGLHREADMREGKEGLHQAAAPLARTKSVSSREGNNNTGPQLDRSGPRIFISGGAGGVGTVAIQLARKLYSASFVATTASKGEKTDLCYELGADEVINYKEFGWAQKYVSKLSSLPGGRLFDVVLDTTDEAKELIKLVDFVGSKTKRNRSNEMTSKNSNENSGASPAPPVGVDDKKLRAQATSEASKNSDIVGIKYSPTLVSIRSGASQRGIATYVRDGRIVAKTIPGIILSNGLTTKFVENTTGKALLERAMFQECLTQAEDYCRGKKRGHNVKLLGCGNQQKPETKAALQLIPTLPKYAFKNVMVNGNGAELSIIAQLLARKEGDIYKLKTVIEKSFYLDKAPQALELCQAGHVKGKLIVVMPEGERGKKL